MAMIDIEYRHSAEPKNDSGEVRRPSVEAMGSYLKGLVSEMLIADISASYRDVRTEGPNMMLINGRPVQEILEGLKIRMPDSEESCDHGSVTIVKFARPTLDWNREIIEDIPDVLVKNAISKVFADIHADRTL